MSILRRLIRKPSRRLPFRGAFWRPLLEELEARNAPADLTGPTASLLAVTPNLTRLAPTLTAQISDVGRGNSRINRAEYFIDTAGANGAGIAMSASDGRFNTSTENVTATLTTSRFNALSQGTHRLYVHGRDAAGNWGTLVSIVFTKDTVAPTAPPAPALDPASNSGSTADNIRRIASQSSL